MKNSRVLLGAAVVTLAAGMAAACGSSSPPSSPASSPASGGSTPASTAGSSASVVATPSLDFGSTSSNLAKLFGQFPMVKGDTTRGVTATSVNFGAVVDETVDNVPEFPGMCAGIQARIELANKLHQTRHHINFTGCQDSGGDPNRTASLLEQAVDVNHDFAMDWTPEVETTTDLLTQDHVPYFGYGTTADFCGSQYPFAFSDVGAGICGAVEVQSGGKTNVISDTVIAPTGTALGLSAKQVRLALVTDDYPKGVLLNEAEANAAKAEGINPVYAEASIPLASTGATINYTPYVSKILAAKPNLIVALIPGPNLVGFVSGLRQAGYNGAVLQALYSDPSIFQNPAVADALNDTYAVNGLGSPSFPSTAWSTIKAAAAAVGASSEVASLGFDHGYASADMFVDALKAFEATGKPLTAENFTNFINSGWTYPGYSNAFAPVQWPASHYVGNGCSSIVQVDNATKQIKGVYTLRCYPVTLKTAP
jgi:branched-chain amino acid transport system substrate-binding protein